MTFSLFSFFIFENISIVFLSFFYNKLCIRYFEMASRLHKNGNRRRVTMRKLFGKPRQLFHPICNLVCSWFLEIQTRMLILLTHRLFLEDWPIKTVKRALSSPFLTAWPSHKSPCDFRNYVWSVVQLEYFVTISLHPFAAILILFLILLPTH